MDPLGGGGNVPQANIELNRFISMVRMYMRDIPELNRLIAGVEHSNRQIVWAIADALSDWNSTPPLITPVGLETHPSMYLLLRAVAISLLESVGILQTRNHLSFSDGGIQVGVSDKTPYIQSWLQLLKNSYEEKKKQLKTAINIESAWDGGVSSEYAYLNDFYGDW